MPPSFDESSASKLEYEHEREIDLIMFTKYHGRLVCQKPAGAE